MVYAVNSSSFDGHSVRTKVGSFGIPPHVLLLHILWPQWVKHQKWNASIIFNHNLPIYMYSCSAHAYAHQFYTFMFAKESRWSYPKPTLHKRVSLLHMLVLIGVWWQKNFSLQLMRPGWVNSGFTKLRVWEQDDFVTWKVLMFVTFEVVVKYHRVFCYMNDERKLGGKRKDKRLRQEGFLGGRIREGKKKCVCSVQTLMSSIWMFEAKLVYIDADCLVLDTW